MQYKVFPAQLCGLPSNIGFPNTSNGLAFQEHSRAIVCRCFFKIGSVKTLANFTEKQLCLSLFLIKLQRFLAATLFKRYFNTSVFLCNMQIFLVHFFCRQHPLAASGNWYSWQCKSLREKCGLCRGGKDHT